MASSPRREPRHLAQLVWVSALLLGPGCSSVAPASPEDAAGGATSDPDRSRGSAPGGSGALPASDAPGGSPAAARAGSAASESPSAGGAGNGGASGAPAPPGSAESGGSAGAEGREPAAGSGGAPLLDGRAGTAGSTSSHAGNTASGGTGGSPASAAKSLPCEVRAVLAERCQTCHRDPPLNDAPMPLLTWSDVSNKATDMQEKLDMDEMPPAGEPDLSERQRGILLDYLAQGTPSAGNVSCR